ncbi:MAG: peptidase subtilisin kexin sedolisin [Deltaproteobacteria bacterium]|nr:peptidase subtilisin kexin sedolisin [Deltaproteobacteria bacterium]
MPAEPDVRPVHSIANGHASADTRKVSALVRISIAITLLVGCVRSGAVECADGWLCPEGTLCVQATATITVCADPDQRAACADLADGDSCAADSGRCYDRTCLPITCNDQLVDPGISGVVPAEMCDDGNNIPGDGCAADCRSDERCGNGVVDPIRSEQCDDGNAFAHDGCGTDCKPEVVSWRPLDQAVLGIRSGHSLTFDPVIGRAVLQGGSSTDRRTLEWSGLMWTPSASQFYPPVTSGTAAAYDVEREEIVLFGGGFGGTADFDDTWVWRRGEWTLIPVASAPPARSGHTMVYDPIRKKVVLFGGAQTYFALNYLQDTWEWDGAQATWTERASSGPVPRAEHVMAFDPIRGTTILFGGEDANKFLGDTWEWNGSTWTKLSVVAPSARADAAVTTYHGGLILYGGRDTMGDLAETWRWNGSAWIDLMLADPGARSDVALATDTLRDRAVLVGGGDAKVWEWNGIKWSVIREVTPPVLSDPAAVLDARRGRGIVFGFDQSASEAVTLGATERGWTVLTTGPSPPSRQLHSLAYDVARDEVVLFGGASPFNGVMFGDTWILDNTPQGPAWSMRNPATAPTPRRDHALSYDRGRARVVLFGGASSVDLDDTWEWDGAIWIEVTPTMRPPPRSGHALVYDPLRHVMVMFGGTNGATLYNDTWEYDGTTWTERVPLGARPVPRQGAALAWNPIRRRMTLFGGDGGMLGGLDDTWEWGGTAWTQVATEGRPPSRSNHVLFPRADGTGLMLYGGRTPQGLTSSVWNLRWSAGRPDEQCAARRDRDGDGLDGCDDPECWATCTPLCGPGELCATDAPRCGDGRVDVHETCQLCPSDLGSCAACGDSLCEPPESHASCLGDCLL